jgi:alpha-tubulin suppressor-like RCC1 family protein
MSRSHRRWPGLGMLGLLCGPLLGCSDSFESTQPKAYVLPDTTFPRIPDEMGRRDSVVVGARVATDSTPEGKTIDKTSVAWTTSDASVVEVKRTGALSVKLKAISVGHAVIVGSITTGAGTVPQVWLVDTVTVHERWIAVDVGRALSCGLNVDSVAYCWGTDTARPLQPEIVPGLFGIPASNLQVGHGTACALLQTSSPFCWGRNGMGEIGLGLGNNRRQPVAVQGFLDVAAGDIERIAAGGAFMCLDIVQSRMWCYGNGTFGQLATDTTCRFFGASVYPCGTIRMPMDVDSIGAGENHACVIELSSKPSGDLVCWGANTTGQLGTPNPDPPQTCPVSASWVRPCRDTLIVVTSDRRFIAVSAGWDHFDPDSTPPWLGEGHTCAIEKASSTVYCWGKNDHEQLGAPSDNTCLGAVWSPHGAGDTTRAVNCRYAPAQITGSGRYKAVRAGADHTCGIQYNDRVYCWGLNADGQLGDGTRTSRGDAELLLTPPHRDSMFVSLDAGPNITCALTKPHGAIYCWGKSIADSLKPETLRDPL